MRKCVITFLAVLSFGVVLVNYKNEDSCVDLVKKVLMKEPGVDHVDNLKPISSSTSSLLISSGEVKMVCSGDVTFTDGTKSFSKFFRSVSEDGKEIVHFEPEIIVEKFRKLLKEESITSI